MEHLVQGLKGSQELTSSCQEWVWLSLIFYPIVFDSWATLWKQKKTSGHVWHLKQVNLPAPDSIVHSLYLQYVAASTWENWKRNTVDVTSSEFLYPLYHQKHSLRNRAFFTPFSHMGLIPSSSSILSQLNPPDPSQKEHVDQILNFQDHLWLYSATFQSHKSP